MAAAMVATSVGITARVLGDMNLLQTLSARIILGAAVFDDVLGMIVLAVVVGLVSSTGLEWAQLLITAIEAIGFALVMMFYAPRVVKRMEPGMERMSTQDAPLIIALAICLGLSYAAVKIGMAAIIGAFFAGLAFAEYSPRWNLRARVFSINEFLAPFFFFSMGARMNMVSIRWQAAGLRHCDFAAGNSFQTGGLRPAGLALRLENGVQGGNRHGAARRSGTHRGFGGPADEYRFRIGLCSGDFYDRHHHAGGAADYEARFP